MSGMHVFGIHRNLAARETLSEADMVLWIVHASLLHFAWSRSTAVGILSP